MKNLFLFVEEAKLQVLANLANFAYDPINYEYLRQLNVVDLFLGKWNFTYSLFFVAHFGIMEMNFL